MAAASQEREIPASTHPPASRVPAGTRAAPPPARSPVPDPLRARRLPARRLPVSACLLLAALLLALLPGASPARAQPPASPPPGSPAPSPPAPRQKFDLQVVVFSRGEPQDAVAVAYQKPPDRETVTRDFAELTAALGVQPVTPRIQRKPNLVSGGTILTAEANLPGVTNWAAGTVNLDPFVRAFRRFGRFKVTLVFWGSFTLKEPMGSGTRGPVHWETTVSGSTVDYEIRVDQSRGVPASVPSTMSTRAGPDWKPIAAIAAILLVVAVSVFLIARILLGQRRAAAPKEREKSNAS